MNENYDQLYRNSDYFGGDPTPLLAGHRDLLPPAARVLDIGIGQGRNALPLARAGCAVTGIDPSSESVRIVVAAAADEGLALEAIRTGFQDYRPDRPFDAILCFGLLQILDPAQVGALVDRCDRWLVPGGLLYLTAWHTGDPSCERRRQEWAEVAPGCFRSPDDPPVHRFYLAPEAIRGLFAGWDFPVHRETMGPWHRHAGGPRERHGEVEAIARKPLIAGNPSDADQVAAADCV